MKPIVDQTRRPLGGYLSHMRRFPPLSHAEEVALGHAVRHGQAAARDRLVQSNLGLVVQVARAYRSSALPLEDLFHEGSLGLIEAARRFDERRGTRFSTYAAFWIRKSILEALRGQSHLVAVTSYSRRRLREVREAERSLRASLKRDPGSAEVSEVLSKSTATVDRLLRTEPRLLSLEEKASRDGTFTLVDCIPDPRHASPEKEMISRESRRFLLSAFSGLTHREQFVLTCRLSLTGGKRLTLREIGAKMALSRERVRQIEELARARFRRLYRKAEDGLLRQGPPEDRACAVNGTAPGAAPRLCNHP
jgi:RNA polymerase sigma factor (sigma-70 family)